MSAAARTTAGRAKSERRGCFIREKRFWTVAESARKARKRRRLSSFVGSETIGWAEHSKNGRSPRSCMQLSFPGWPEPLIPVSFKAMQYQTFCGGIFETNCYLLEAPGGPILFDAPDGACDWLVGEGI